MKEIIALILRNWIEFSFPYEYEHQLNTIRRNKGDNMAQAKLFC